MGSPREKQTRKRKLPTQKKMTADKVPFAESIMHYALCVFPKSHVTRYFLLILDHLFVLEYLTINPSVELLHDRRVRTQQKRAVHATHAPSRIARYSDCDCDCVTVTVATKLVTVAAEENTVDVTALATGVACSEQAEDKMAEGYLVSPAGVESADGEATAAAALRFTWAAVATVMVTVEVALAVAVEGAVTVVVAVV